MDLFLLKNIITVLIMPLNIVILLLIFALLVHRNKPKKAIKNVYAALIILAVSAFAPFSDTVMTAIENDYPPYVKSKLPIDYIVVLGCEHKSNVDLPVTSQLGNCSLQRMVEALRIYELHPEARIITSGYGGYNLVSNAETVKQALVLFGVPAQKVITENFPKDTEEEAQLIAPRVQDTQVILVTNASHMPRAMNYFQAEGIYPIAAPTGYWVKNSESKKDWFYYVPNSENLEQSTRAWYESLGLVVQWFKSLVN